MDSPYRSGTPVERADAPSDRGIVGDVVAQFADPLAFLRELVQNAIDAGSPSIDVELRHDAAAAALRAIVRDRGEGMDRDLVENHLLVLFRSTKDRDPTKIGKFGIGFSSVLAPGPRVVVVDTVRAGRRLVLHLHPDLTYQLFEGGPATRSGTTVELELPIEPGAVADLITRSRRTLVRWCRHAAVPIRLVARGAGGDVLLDVRIDTPLALEDALVEVRGVSADGGTTAVVGLLRDGARYAGFFNRGLMLHESDAPLVGQVGFKVIDARLGHTLSRDDVRRDGVFDDVLGLVRGLVARELPRAAAVALAMAATDDLPRWCALFEALDHAELGLDADDWVVPLVAPVGGDRAIAASTLPRHRAWSGEARTPLIDLLAAGGVAVVAQPVAGVAARVARSCERWLVQADVALTAVVAVVPTDAELVVLDELAALLDRAGRAAKAIVLAELTGALADEPCVNGGRGDALFELGADRWVIDVETGRANPFRRLWRRTLIVNARHAIVVAARAHAERGPVEAASALARAVLLYYGRLDVATSEELLVATVARLGLRGSAR